MTAGAELVAERDCIVPQWRAPARVRALMTTRAGGVSGGARATLDLGGHDSHDAMVRENRRRLRSLLPGEPHWLHQVHGRGVVTLDRHSRPDGWPEADGAVTADPELVCAVRVADCLPVLLADGAGCCVGVAHAGWRGLAAGVLEATVDAMRALGSARQVAWLGPALGPNGFEVGREVLEACSAGDPGGIACFGQTGPDRWHGDLYALARRRLAAQGILDVAGGDHCTRTQAEQFFSYRRERDSGRMAALIWLQRENT